MKVNGKNQSCQPIPSFIDSPYFVEEPFNWHLKEDAPEELKKEFEEYMKSDYEEIGVIPCPK
jgi:hypothetical protein